MRRIATKKSAHVQFGPRLCENSKARRERRIIVEKFRVMRTDNAADIWLDAMLENCIFYISRMYEFSHSLDPKRTLIDFLVMTGNLKRDAVN